MTKCSSWEGVGASEEAELVSGSTGKTKRGGVFKAQATESFKGTEGEMVLEMLAKKTNK